MYIQWNNVPFVRSQIFIVLAHWNNSLLLEVSLPSDKLSWFLVVLAHWNNSLLLEVSLPSDILSWFLVGLAHWNNSLLLEVSLPSDILSWFLANQSLLLLLNKTCYVEKQQIPILYM